MAIVDTDLERARSALVRSVDSPDLTEPQRKALRSVLGTVSGVINVRAGAESASRAKPWQSRRDPREAQLPTGDWT